MNLHTHATLTTSHNFNENMSFAFHPLLLSPQSLYSLVTPSHSTPVTPSHPTRLSPSHFTPVAPSHFTLLSLPTTLHSCHTLSLSAPATPCHSTPIPTIHGENKILRDLSCRVECLAGKSTCILHLYGDDVQQLSVKRDSKHRVAQSKSRVAHKLREETYYHQQQNQCQKIMELSLYA